MTIGQVELIKKKKFAVAAFDLEHKAFVVHITALSINLGDEVHFSRKAQIAHLKADEAPTKISSKYTDFADVFFPKLAAELLEYTGINDHAIELIDD